MKEQGRQLKKAQSMQKIKKKATLGGKKRKEEDEREYNFDDLHAYDDAQYEQIGNQILQTFQSSKKTISDFAELESFKDFHKPAIEKIDEIPHNKKSPSKTKKTPLLSKHNFKIIDKPSAQSSRISASSKAHSFRTQIPLKNQTGYARPLANKVQHPEIEPISDSEIKISHSKDPHVKKYMDSRMKKIVDKNK